VKFDEQGTEKITAHVLVCESHPIRIQLQAKDAEHNKLASEWADLYQEKSDALQAKSAEVDEFKVAIKESMARGEEWERHAIRAAKQLAESQARVKELELVQSFPQSEVESQLRQRVQVLTEALEWIRGEAMESHEYPMWYQQAAHDGLRLATESSSSPAQEGPKS